MKLGFCAGGLRNIPLADKIKWAGENSFNFLDVPCWPFYDDRDYSNTDIDAETLTHDKINEINKSLIKNEVEISSLIYYDNNLSEDRLIRKQINEHLYNCIDAAEMLGVPQVCTMTGRDCIKSIYENFYEFKRIFSSIVNYAKNKNICITIMNSPMYGWLIPSSPGTISFSPELWREMFRLIPYENFGLNYDPSYMYYQMLDYIRPFDEFKDRIFHVQIKDIKLNSESFGKYGIFNKQIFTDNDKSNYTFTAAGRGDLSFEGIFDKLKEINYCGDISIDHQDQMFEGAQEKIKEGMLLSMNYLKSFLL